MYIHFRLFCNGRVAEIWPNYAKQFPLNVKTGCYIPCRLLTFLSDDRKREAIKEEGFITGNLKMQKDIHKRKLSDKDIAKIKSRFRLQSLYSATETPEHLVVKGFSLLDVQNSLLYLDKFLSRRNTNQHLPRQTKEKASVPAECVLNLSMDESSKHAVLFLYGFRAIMKKHLEKTTKCKLHMNISPPYSIIVKGNASNVETTTEKLDVFIEGVLKQHGMHEVVPISNLHDGQHLYGLEDFLCNHPLFKVHNQLAQLGKDPSFFMIPHFAQPFGVTVFANSSTGLSEAKEKVEEAFLHQREKCYENVILKEDSFSALQREQNSLLSPFSANLSKKTKCSFVLIGEGTNIDRRKPAQAVVFGPTKTDVDHGLKHIEAFINHKGKLFFPSKAKTVSVLKFSYDKKAIQSLLESDGEILYKLEKETDCNIHLKLGKKEGSFHIVLTGEHESHVMEAEVVVRKFFKEHNKKFIVMKSVKLPSVDGEEENILFDFFLGRDKASHRKKLENDYKCALIFDVQNSSLNVYVETEEQLKETLTEVEKVIQKGVEKFARLKFRSKFNLPEDLDGLFVKKICSGVGSLQGALEQETECSLLIRGVNGKVGFADRNSPFYILVCAESQEILRKGLEKIKETIERESAIYRMEFFFSKPHQADLTRQAWTEIRNNATK